MNEKNLIQQVLSNDNVAQKEFYEKFAPIFNRFLKKKYFKNQEIEEIIQETFISIFQNDWRVLRNFKWQSSLETYLIKILKCRVADYYSVKEIKTEQRIRSLQKDKESTEEIKSKLLHNNPEIDAINNERNRKLAIAMEKLSIDERKLFELILLEGKTYKQASEVLKQTTNNVGVRYLRIKKKLISLLQQNKL